jgi:hypothetical protein
LAKNENTAADAAVNKAASGLNRAFTTATAGIKGFAGGLLDTNPQLSDLTSGLGKLNAVVKYLEGGLGALQAFSRVGVDFDMSIGQMNRSAAGARMKLDEMAGIVTTNTDLFLGMGVGIRGVGDSVQQFLNSQKSFFFDEKNKMTEATLRLQRLGLTTKDINESFLTYDAIENYRRKGERLTTAERNAAAANFTKSLDKLSKLTGKQTEQINKEIRQKMRQGDVAAFSTTLEKDARKDFLKATSFMGNLGPDMSQLFEDLVIRKFPGEDVAPLVSLMPKTAAAFLEYGRILKTGTKEQREAALATAAATAAEEQQIERNRSLAMLGNRVNSNVTSQIQKVVGDGALGLAEALRDVNDEIKREGGNVAQAGINFFERVAKRQEELMDAPQKKDPKTGKDIIDNERLATDALLKLQGVASEMAVEAQKQIGNLYVTLGTSADKFADYVRNTLDVSKEVGDVLSTLRTALGVGGSNMATAIETSNAAIQNAIRSNNPELAAEINTLVTKLKEAPESERTKLIEALGDKLKEAMKLTWEAQTVVINSRGEVVVHPTPSRHQMPNREGERQGAGDDSSIGTQGAVGRLFRNFGRETSVALHGIQSVQTPEQTTEIMKNSALGALRAVDDIFSAGNFSSSISKNIIPTIESIAANNVQTLNGMLNTMQNTSRQMVSNASPKGMDMGELTSSFRTAMNEIRKPIEDVAKSLKGPMEQLAQTAGQQLEIQQKHLKATKGLTNDALRGIA